MELAKVNAYYQVTLPKSVRQRARGQERFLSYVKVGYRDGAIFIRPVTFATEKRELNSLRRAVENKFAEVWKDEDDAAWESYL